MLCVVVASANPSNKQNSSRSTENTPSPIACSRHSFAFWQKLSPRSYSSSHKYNAFTLFMCVKHWMRNIIIAVYLFVYIKGDGVYNGWAELNWAVCVCAQSRHEPREQLYTETCCCAVHSHIVHIWSTPPLIHVNRVRSKNEMLGRGVVGDLTSNHESVLLSFIVVVRCSNFVAFRYISYAEDQSSITATTRYFCHNISFPVSYSSQILSSLKLFGCDPPVNSSSASVWALLFSFCICLSTFFSVNVFFKTYSFFRVQSD